VTDRETDGQRGPLLQLAPGPANNMSIVIVGIPPSVVKRNPHHNVRMKSYIRSPS